MTRLAGEAEGALVADKVHDAHMRGLARKNVSTSSDMLMQSRMYYAPEVFDLERRAIFSKRWLLVSHKARYPTVGDFVQYEVAGFSFVVVKNKKQEIVGFHNICRHRAFPVVQAQSGKARIFSCKYHGWSYDLDGKLTKAPRFSGGEVEAFDPSSKALFPIHVHVDRNGFVYVNLDAGEVPSISWDDQYGLLDQQDVLKSAGVDWETVEYDFTWVEEGNFNWKLMQDNYNECYHCLTAHPDVARTTNLDTYYVVPGGTSGSYIAHFNEPKSSSISAFDETRFAGRSATHVFPVSHFSPNPGTGFMHLMRSVPTGPTTTRQEYDVYKLNTPLATPEAHQRMIKFYQKVTKEDIDLCNAVQKNMERRVYVSGLLHPFHEEGVVAFQKMLKDVLISHLEEEEKIGREIWPSERPPDDAPSENDCSKILACRDRKALKW